MAVQEGIEPIAVQLASPSGQCLKQDSVIAEFTKPDGRGLFTPSGLKIQWLMCTFSDLGTKLLPAVKHSSGGSSSSKCRLRVHR